MGKSDDILKKYGVQRQIASSSRQRAILSSERERATESIADRIVKKYSPGNAENLAKERSDTITGWFDGVQKLGQRVQKQYGNGGYLSQDKTLAGEVDSWLSSAGEIDNLLSATRDRYADYDAVRQGYDQLTGYLRQLKEAMAQEEEKEIQAVRDEALSLLQGSPHQLPAVTAKAQSRKMATSGIYQDAEELAQEQEEYWQATGQYEAMELPELLKLRDKAKTDMDVAQKSAVAAEGAYGQYIDSPTGAGMPEMGMWTEDMEARSKELLQNAAAASEQLAAAQKQYEKLADLYTYRSDMATISSMTELEKKALEAYMAIGSGIGNSQRMAEILKGLPEEQRALIENPVKYLQEQGYSLDDLARLSETWERNQNEERMQKAYGKYKEWAKKAPALHYPLTFGANLAGNITGFVSSAEGYLRDAAGLTSYHSMDPNSPGYMPEVYAGTVRDAMSGNLPDYAKPVFNGVNSAVDSLLRVAAGGGTGALGLAAMGSFGSTVREVTLQGGTPEQAVMLGVANAGLEVLTEKLSIDNLLNAKTPETGMQLVWNLAKQGLIEVSEEEASYVGSLVAETAILGQNSGFNRRVAELQTAGKNEEDAKKVAWSELFQEAVDTAVTSFISGSIMGGTGAAVKTVKNNTGKLILESLNGNTSSGTEERISPLASGSVEMTDGDTSDALRKLAMEKIDAEQQGQDMENTAPEDGVKYSIKRTQNMSWDEQISGALSRGENIGRNDTLVLDDTPATLVNDGVEGKKLAIPLSVITKAKSGKDASHSIKDTNLKELQRGVRNAPIMINNPVRNAIVFVTDIKQDGAPVLLAFQKNTEFDGDTVHKATSIHLQMDVASMLKALPSEATVYAKNESELDTAVGVADNLRSLAANVKFTGDTVTENVAGVNGEIPTTEGKILRGKDAVEVVDIATAGGGKVTVTLTDGSTADVSELSFRDVGEQELWRVIAQYAENAEAARQLLKEYRAGSMDAYAYARGAEEAILYGRANISEKEMEVRGSYVNQMDPMQRKMAYTLGRIAGEKRTRQRQAEASERNAKRQRKGSVNYGYEGQALDKSKLTKAQRVGVDFAERLARKKGMTFYFYRSYVNDQGQRVYKDQKGRTVAADKNGWYDPENGSIHIDLNCGDMGGTVLFTLAHELTHFIQDWSPTKYRTLCGILTEGYLDMGQSIQELVQHKQEDYKAKGEELSYEDAFDEVIASSMEGVLADGRVMELLDEIETKDQSLYEKVRSFIEDVAALIFDTIQAYRNFKPDSPEGRIVARMQGIHEQLKQVFAEGLHEGGENYRQGGKENTTQEGGVKSALRVFDDGTRFVDVQMDATVFSNLTVAEMNQKVKAILMERFAGKVIGIDNRVFVNGDSVNEYLHPSKNIDRATRETKLVAGSELDNLLDAGTPLPNEPDGKDGHIHPEVKDFSYLKTIFKVGNEYFEGIVNIKNVSKGRLLKDITKIRNITKDIVSSYGSNPKSNFLRDVSMDSIRSSQEKVNKNSVRYQKNAAAREHLEKENASMGEDVAGLNELVAAMRRQGNRGNLQKGTLDASASVLMEKAGARGKKTELMELLDTFYQYIGNGEDLSWDGIRKAARPVVDWLMNHVARSKQLSEYAREVLSELRTSRVFLDETQKGEAAHQFGSYGAFRNMLMGSVTIANEGSISLDSRWHELSQLYPDVFREDVSAADMPGELVDIINRMRNTDTSELEFEYNREFMEQELLYRIYGSYWNASTLYIVAGQHEAQIRQLKGKHNQRMNEVYQRHRDMEERQRQTHRQRQEAARHHYEEQYQKREAEYRESRRKAVERHDMAEVRQRIRKDVQRLDSLLNKGNRKKNVKEGLKEFVGAALRLAKGVFLKDYNEYDMIRSGLTTNLLSEEKAAYARCRELLQELDSIRDEKNKEPGADSIHGKWDPEQAMRRDDREEALKKELSKNMAVLREGNVFQRERGLAEDATAEQLADELLGAYQKLADTEYEHLQGEYSKKVYDQIGTVRDFLKGKAIKDMTSVELRELQKLYRMISEAVSRADELFGAYKNEKTSKRGNRILDQLETERDADISTAVNKLKEFGWSLLTPEVAAEIIGSEELTRAIRDVMAGEIVQQEDMENAKQFAAEQAEKFNRKNWDTSRQVKFAGTEITIGQAMALFAYTERKAGRNHISGDGFTHSKEVPIKQKRGKLKINAKFIKDTTRAYRVTEDMYDELGKLLTQEQKNYARAMRDYLAEVMGAKGNEVSMELYGIEMYGEKFYFPLKSAKSFLDSTLGAKHGEVKVTNQGFTKPLQEGASNAIVLEDLEMVWAKHVQEMSTYHALGVAMENFNRLYNYRKTEQRETVDKWGQPVTEEVKSREPVSLHIERRAVGGTGYLVKWMESVNGGVRSDATEQLLGGALGNFRKTAVLGNLSVIVQQPTAILRAAPYLGKDFLAGWKTWKATTPEKGLIREMYRYCKVAGLKKAGGFDPSAGRTVRQYLFDGRDDSKGKIKKGLDQFNEVLGMAPEKMDELAWSYLWLCCKKKTLRENRHLRAGSKEHCQVAAELFTQIVRESQVYDSVMSKPLIMQSKNVFIKSVTSFKNEPLKGLNQCILAVARAKNGRISRLEAAQHIVYVYASNLLARTVSSLIYALRDDDEDETYWEKFRRQFAGGLLDWILPFGSIPGISDVISIMQGYGSERAEFAVISDAWTGIQKLVKESKAETPEEIEKEVWDKLEIGLGNVLNLFGVPGRNLIREVRGIYYRVKQWGDTKETDAGARYAVTEGLTGKATSKAKQLGNAVAEDDAEHLLRVMSTYDEEKEAMSALVSGIREAWIEGRVSDDRAMEYLQEYGGKSQKDAAEYITKWEFKKAHPKSELTRVLDYIAFCEPAGISLEIFEQYCEKVEGMTSDYDEDGEPISGKGVRDKKLAIIDSLPITKVQKDAIYYAEDFAESTLKNAPWH